MPRHRIAPFALLLALVGCGEDPPPTRPKVPVVSGPIVEHTDASKGTEFADAKFPCCDTDLATGLVGAYVGLSEALAADDAAKAQERVTALSGAVAAVTTGPPKELQAHECAEGVPPGDGPCEGML